MGLSRPCRVAGHLDGEHGMSVLVVVAHPDDEVLGCGGTIYRLTTQGIEVHVAMMSGAVTARERRPGDTDLDDDIDEAMTHLGVVSVRRGPFPNIRMNTVDHLDLVKYVEEALQETGAEWVFTHHPHDLNDDHRQTSVAAQAAARIHQRGNGGSRLRGLLFMEILSSTDWQFGGTGRPFEPTGFFEIGPEGIEAKLRALGGYRDVMRPYPHPRSEESVRALARVRGSEAGMNHAEAFQVAHLDLGTAL